MPGMQEDGTICQHMLDACYCKPKLAAASYDNASQYKPFPGSTSQCKPMQANVTKCQQTIMSLNSRFPFSQTI
jgi:hypothetical protein